MAIDAFFCAVVFLRFAIQWLSRAFELLRQFYCLAGIRFQSFGGPLLPFPAFSSFFLETLQSCAFLALAPRSGGLTCCEGAPWRFEVWQWEREF